MSYLSEELPTDLARFLTDHRLQNVASPKLVGSDRVRFSDSDIRALRKLPDDEDGFVDVHPTSETTLQIWVSGTGYDLYAENDDPA